MDGTRQLLQSASKGDPAALTELLQRYLPELQTFIRLRVGRHILAKESSADLVQSVCLEALGELGDFDYQGEVPFKRWLFRASLRKIHDRNRFYKREMRDPEREVPGSPTELGLFQTATPSRDAIRNEELDELEEVLAELPDDYRTVILLSRFLEMDHNEIADEMGRKPGAVRVLLHRALAKLGKVLSDRARTDGET